MTTRYVTVTETAKIIRAELKAAFPATKFSVRSSKYAGGASIQINYTDGPTPARVEAITGQYAGARFDSMVDLKSYVTTTDAKGQPVRYGADYVFVSREISPRFRDRLHAAVVARYGLRPLAEGERDVYLADWGCFRSTLIHRAAANRMEVQRPGAPCPSCGGETEAADSGRTFYDACPSCGIGFHIDEDGRETQRWAL